MGDRDNPDGLFQRAEFWMVMALLACLVIVVSLISLRHSRRRQQ
jgi:uncharacterized membrane protein YhaH (DUF805 family)